MSAAPTPRSWLFVPADSEKKLGKIASCGADAVILDLEDAVAPERKDAGRAMAREYLSTHAPGARTAQVWVRVNPFDTGLTDADLDAVIAARPDGIVQPKIDGPNDVRRLSEAIALREGDPSSQSGAIPILPIATEVPRAVFALGDFADAGLSRLAGLTWGAEDLATEIGATTNRGSDGRFLESFRIARALTLFAAHAARVPAIDTLHADFRDEAGLIASSRAARAEGFSGRLAIHPAQVAPINAAFTPSREEIAHAQRIVEAFAAAPGAGTVGMDGKMVDRPHLRAAERVLAQARAHDG